MQNLNNKLQSEKNRLAMAIQACEAAAACISRPSSPLEAVPSASDKELAVRARLEDLIDQLQIRLTNLDVVICKLCVCLFSVANTIYVIFKLATKNHCFIGEMEEYKKQREAIREWVIQQKNVVNDWKLKPAKLRADNAKQELNSMNSLLVQISEKRNKLLTEISSSGEPEEAESSLEAQMDDLEQEVREVFLKFEL